MLNDWKRNNEEFISFWCSYCLVRTCVAYQSIVKSAYVKYLQRHIWEPVRDIYWNFLEKYVAAKSCYFFPKSTIVDDYWIKTVPLISFHGQNLVWPKRI